MGASQQKRNRAQQREDGSYKKLVEKREAEEKARKEKRTITIVSIVIAVVVILLIVVNSSLFYRSAPAVTAGGVTYSASDLSFYYKSSYYNYLNTYGSYIEMLGLNLDQNKSLSTQAYPYEEGKTWADYFKESALENMARVTMLYTRAQEAGFTLDEEAQAELDEVLLSFDSSHENTGYGSANEYLAAAYGKGLTLERVKELVSMSYIAEGYGAFYEESFEYTADELQANYEENKDDYDSYTYLQSFVSGEASEDGSIDAETAMASAKETADSIVEDSAANADDEDEESPEETAFKQKALALNGEEPTESTTQGSSLSTVYGDWLKDPARKYGDKTVIEDTQGYYVLFFLNRDTNDYKLPSVRHILIKVETDDEGAFTDEAKEEALEKAETILAQWKDGGATEESFAEAANLNSEDTGSNTTGGFYENFPKGAMVESFNDWVYDSSRKTGDTGIVFNEGSYVGYHIIYFVGYGDTYRNYLADTALRTASYEEWTETQMALFEATSAWAAFFVK